MRIRRLGAKAEVLARRAGTAAGFLRPRLLARVLSSRSSRRISASESGRSPISRAPGLCPHYSKGLGSGRKRVRNGGPKIRRVWHASMLAVVGLVELPDPDEEFADLAVALDGVALEFAAQLGADLELQGDLLSAGRLREVVLRVGRGRRSALPFLGSGQLRQLDHQAALSFTSSLTRSTMLCASCSALWLRLGKRVSVAARPSSLARR